jgi:uncharacterized protein (DUF433 family)
MDEFFACGDLVKQLECACEYSITFPEGIPLNYDHDGNIRVKGSRVTLDSLVECMQAGDTIEEIHEGFPSVTLAEINTILGWYLNNQVEADKYLREQDAEAERIRKEIESEPGYMLLREKLLRYREQRLKT